MIIVSDKDGNLREERGNPTLISLDGELRAPLATIMHWTWTPRDRARFGVYEVELPAPPLGQVVVSYDLVWREGVPAVNLKTADAPPPPPIPTLDEKLARIGVTLAELKKALER